MTQRKQWKARASKAAARVERAAPAAKPAIEKAKVLARLARNLAHWASEDSRSIREMLDLAAALGEPVKPLAPETRSTVYRHPGGARRVICSYATGTHLRLLAIAAPTYIDYAQRYGWDVVLSTEEELAGERPPAWAKVPLIKQLLDDYDLVWWIDADAIIVDPSVPIDDQLEPDKDLYLVEHTWDSGMPVYAANTGVMLFRSTEWSHTLLDEVWALEKYTWHKIWENAAFIELMGYDPFPLMFHRQPTKWMERIKFIPLEWNSVWPNPSPAPLINHHGGELAMRTRRERMLLDLYRNRNGIKPRAQQPPHGRHDPSWTYLTPARPAHRMVREDIPLMLNERGLVGAGAEIGVFAGQFSNRILSTWNGRHLMSIDPWLQATREEYDDVSNVEQSDQESNYAAARARLEQFGDRSTIWRMTSEEAAGRIPNACLDFVYIDARHDEASVHEDLELWLPKVRPGGIFAGHDYVDGDLPEGRFGVKSAVDRFFGERRLKVHVTREPGFPSWIVEIP